jgi:hypothetical protein
MQVNSNSLDTFAVVRRGSGKGCETLDRTIGPIERDILTALLFCALIPDFRLMQLNNFSIFVCWRMQKRFNEVDCFNVATPVAYSDSFAHCHERRSYFNSITNERHVIDRYCSNIVLLDIGKLTSRCNPSCIHASKLPRRRVYMQARNREGEKSIEKLLIRFQFSCTRIGALHIRWFSAWVRWFSTWVRCVITAGEMIGMRYAHMHTCTHPKLFKDVFFAYVLIVIQPLLGAVLVHSLCCNTHTRIPHIFLTVPLLFWKSAGNPATNTVSYTIPYNLGRFHMARTYTEQYTRQGT